MASCSAPVCSSVAHSRSLSRLSRRSQAELQRSALRTIFQLSKLSTPGTTPKFEEVVEGVKRGEWARDWAELQREQ